MNTLLDRFRAKYAVDPGGCWLWTAHVHAIGYGVFRVAPGRIVQAHRFAYESFIGPIPEGMKVCHKCDVRHCVNPDHLWLGTQKENVRDMWAKGRAPKRSSGHKRPDNGSRNRAILGKLTREQVLEIRQNPNVRLIDFASRFGVDSSIICHVRAGRTYKDIQPV